MKNNIGPTIEKLMATLNRKLDRQTIAVQETTEHIEILKTKQGELFSSPIK